ncbi:hypothetical protein EA462_17040 [Natrarchaeobius halalkaliphilus]|uniref:HTH iclR-type domain-containing protein n=1 Tax=Natrarchaeobius halalkaliphilus TaxID=1679091 RepID=A0A3N6LHS8_9EURY|nr:hypothetical protein [Natrarchaeobius halalkaliphilus]RQG86175.1 hypothetical protein EA462_17040 [Natrarchaeobius halalkaliphilus]
MIRSVSVGFVVLLVVLSVAGVSSPTMLTHTAAGDGSETYQTVEEPIAPSTLPISQSDIDSSDFDTTTFEIVVHKNGSATWTFRHEQRLDGSEDESEAEARSTFQAFAEEFESEDAEPGLYQRFTDQALALTDRGNEVTDREMDATDFTRSARIDEQLNPMGIVEMSFVWHGFAAADNGTVVVGDVFQDIYITDDQSILIEADDDLVFQTAEPDPQYVGANLENADSVQWSGEREFLDGHPRVVFEHAEPESGNSNTGPLSSVTGGDDGERSWSSVAPVLGGVILTALASVFVWHRRRGTNADDDHGDVSQISRPAETDAVAADSGGAELRSEPEKGVEAETISDGSLNDDDLLTDEDRVIKLIRENGGRMKQVNIVEDTGWSKSKVSMLLSDMEDEGTISKLRVGRENIISLDGFEPEATKSPFEK